MLQHWLSVCRSCKNMGVCSVMNGREKQNSRGEREVLQDFGGEIIHYTAGFIMPVCRGQASVSSDRWGKVNTI